MSSERFEVRSFTGEDLAQVRGLFADGITEYWKGIDHVELHEFITAYVNYCLNDDMIHSEKFIDMFNTYFNKGGHFWVAVDKEKDGKGAVIGTLGLEVLSEKGTVELRRMSVNREYRRNGIAKMLLNTLESFAIQNNFTKVVVSTNSYFIPAIKFYTQNGFKFIRSEADPNLPKNLPFEASSVYYEKEL